MFNFFYRFDFFFFCGERESKDGEWTERDKRDERDEGT